MSLVEIVALLLLSLLVGVTLGLLRSYHLALRHADADFKRACSEWASQWEISEEEARSKGVALAGAAELLRVMVQRYPDVLHALSVREIERLNRILEFGKAWVGGTGK